MQPEVKVKVSRELAIRIPRAPAEAVGLKEGSYVKLRVEGSRIIVEPIPDPLEYALEGPKFAETSFEEAEKVSEELQDELLG